MTSSGVLEYYKLLTQWYLIVVVIKSYLKQGLAFIFDDRGHSHGASVADNMLDSAIHKLRPEEVDLVIIGSVQVHQAVRVANEAVRPLGEYDTL